MKSFKQEIVNSPIGRGVDTTNVNELVAVYDNTLSTILDRHALLITKLVRNLPKRPWYNDSINECKAKKRQLERKWIKSKSPGDWIKFKF